MKNIGTTSTFGELVKILRMDTGCGLRDAVEALRLHKENLNDAVIHIKTAHNAVAVKGPKPICGFGPCEVDKPSNR